METSSERASSQNATVAGIHVLWAPRMRQLQGFTHPGASGTLPRAPLRARGALRGSRSLPDPPGDGRKLARTRPEAPAGRWHDSLRGLQRVNSAQKRYRATWTLVKCVRELRESLCTHVQYDSRYSTRAPRPCACFATSLLRPCRWRPCCRLAPCCCFATAVLAAPATQPCVTSRNAAIRREYRTI